MLLELTKLVNEITLLLDFLETNSRPSFEDVVNQKDATSTSALVGFSEGATVSEKKGPLPSTSYQTLPEANGGWK
jgi:hypothetical protein